MTSKKCSSIFCPRYGKKAGLRCWFHRWARVTPEVWNAQDEYRKELARKIFFGA